jgi:hypothetical protein
VALTSVRDKGARWSSYSASHSTFEMLVGEPYAEGNIVLSMPACKSVAGPVEWPVQSIEVLWRCDGEGANSDWEFEVRDERVGFRAVGAMFRWRRGYDLWAQGGLWFGRGAGPSAPLNPEQAEEAMAKLLRHFYNGMLGYTELGGEVCRVLEQLPVVKTQPGATDE